MGDLQIHMKLTPEELKILNGADGLEMQKIMRTLVLYGDALGAERLVEIEGEGHFSIPFCIPGTGPSLEMLNELAGAGLKTKYHFTLDPLPPLDFKNLVIKPEQEKCFKEMFAEQDLYDKRMLQLGLRGKEAYTCTPYLPEVGNIPHKGTILAWSESSCVVYVNSVLGARTNRNGAIIDLLSNIAGKTPLTGLLTDEGRRANWMITVDTKVLPQPQLLGAAIGGIVMDGVPYITGLDRFLGSGLNERTLDYLKEMGAVCAAIGAVGLYHIENITPEAVEQGISLLIPRYKTSIIDDSFLKNLYSTYPVQWEDKTTMPQKCLIGCPHLSLRELYWWKASIISALRAKGKKRVAVPTILCAAPQVLAKFIKDDCTLDFLRNVGVNLSPTCAEAYMDNPLCASEAIITNSNKLRAFTTARYYIDEELLEVIITGQLKGGRANEHGV